MDFIVRQKSFWGSDDESVLRAIHEGFVQTHQAMWKELGECSRPSRLIALTIDDFLSLSSETWPKTASGLPSTAGTTASIAFIRRGKIYVGHVGDSAIVLGVRPEESARGDHPGGQKLVLSYFIVPSRTPTLPPPGRHAR